ncbi:hypothetical protein [Aquibacillus sediminis]|uniref:hypothetical protein n=1 Tax=Aquibacillus sediminis TaxID=2574734 RepID=UPI0011086EF4|nr:hypothetical protein [Aquibacillus sediminis]
MNFMYILQILCTVVGLYLVTTGLWELKEGKDRKKYILLMFFGLFLIFVFPNFFNELTMSLN